MSIQAIFNLFIVVKNISSFGSNFSLEFNLDLNISDKIFHV